MTANDRKMLILDCFKNNEDIILQHKKVAVYPYRQNGIMVGEILLSEFGIHEITYVDDAKTETTILLEDMDDTTEAVLWIICVKDQWLCDHTKKTLLSTIPKAHVLEVVTDSKNLWLSRQVLDHLGLMLTAKCNLNCRYCADLCAYRLQDEYTYESLIYDMRKLLNAVEYINEILLIGGGTLLYQDLGRVVSWLSKEKKIKKIIIVTNGTISPSEDMWDAFVAGNIILRISGYPESIVKNRESLLAKAAAVGVVTENLEGMQWHDVGSNHKRYRNEDGLKAIFAECGMKYCVTMRNGLIFFCSRQMVAYETTEYPKPLKTEYIYTREEEDIRQKFTEFYEQEKISTCDYCDGISDALLLATVPTAEQILPSKAFEEMLMDLSEKYIMESGEYVHVRDQTLLKVRDYRFEEAGCRKRFLSGKNTIVITRDASKAGCYIADPDLYRTLLNSTHSYV